ncbi:MAG: HipA domain-containing protein [Defluviitaleaceae bacterium]|nr:HipA domain-containing protein [Defluviitaleaceae bacterium]
MMVKLTNFDNCPEAESVYYGGDAGAKETVIYKDSVWMLKFPKTTRDMYNPQISYTTSPLSEYVGSKVYGALGMPVHETELGIRKGKVVVACKDFTRVVRENGAVRIRLINSLTHFHDLKNNFMSSDLDAYSGTGSETLIDEVLATIKGQKTLITIEGVLERFWDMFVVDAFLGNNDRNNGNWGVLVCHTEGTSTLAPVYDNGNSFYNKRSLAQMKSHMESEKSMQEDAYLSPLSAYKYAGLDSEGQQINPFNFIKGGENADCNAAVARFLKRVDFGSIEAIIKSLPEVSDVLMIMPQVQKDFYLELMRIRLDFIRKIGG